MLYSFLYEKTSSYTNRVANIIHHLLSFLKREDEIGREYPGAKWYQSLWRSMTTATEPGSSLHQNYDSLPILPSLANSLLFLSLCFSAPEAVRIRFNSTRGTIRVFLQKMVSIIESPSHWLILHSKFSNFFPLQSGSNNFKDEKYGSDVMRHGLNGVSREEKCECESNLSQGQSHPDALPRTRSEGQPFLAPARPIQPSDSKLKIFFLVLKPVLWHFAPCQFATDILH